MAGYSVRLSAFAGSAALGLAVLIATPADATSYEWSWWGPYGSEVGCNQESQAQNEPQYGTWTYPCAYYPAGAVYSYSEAGWYFRKKVSLD